MRVIARRSDGRIRCGAGTTLSRLASSSAVSARPGEGLSLRKSTSAAIAFQKAIAPQYCPEHANFDVYRAARHAVALAGFLAVGNVRPRDVAEQLLSEVCRKMGNGEFVASLRRGSDAGARFEPFARRDGEQRREPRAQGAPQG